MTETGESIENTGSKTASSSLKPIAAVALGLTVVFLAVVSQSWAFRWNLLERAEQASKYELVEILEPENLGTARSTLRRVFNMAYQYNIRYVTYNPTTKDPSKIPDDAGGLGYYKKGVDVYLGRGPAKLYVGTNYEGGDWFYFVATKEFEEEYKKTFPRERY